jgi:hypothetical protein
MEKFLEQADQRNVDDKSDERRYTLRVVTRGYGVQLARLIFMDDLLPVQHCLLHII